MTTPARTALITGVTGQDGVYLARRLLAEGMRVVGIARPGSARGPRVAAYLPGVEVREADITDAAALRSIVADAAPAEIYNLAALSSVGRSWDEPELTRQVNHGTVVELVAAAQALRASGHPVRLFQASSAEVVGQAADSPYARAKADAEQVIEQARAGGLHASYARLYVHESPIRPPGFVFRKITRGAAEIALGARDELTLGTLDIRRDWGHAGEYVDAFVRMVRRDEPVDLPLGTGIDHSLADLVDLAFAAAGVSDPWSRIVQDPDLVRPADSKVLRADPEPAAEAIGWRATTSFADLVARMVATDLQRVRSGIEDHPSYL